MQLVAIGELGGPIDATLVPLAADLQTTAYELRLVLNAGLPAVVLITAEASVAQSAVAAISRHGHTAVSCDRREAVPSAHMTALRDFRLEPDGLVAHEGSGQVLEYGDIVALLRALHRTTTESVEKVKERKLRPAMAIATGGLITSKTVKRDVITRTEQREQVLYIFRRRGAPPWILRERSARYGGLGEVLRPTSLENFSSAVERIRERAPSAAYDDRLMTSRPIRGVAAGVGATDILAHLLAKYLVARPL